MTVKLNDIALTDTDTTQLSYSITTNPNPLQISSQGSITVSVYRANPPAIECNQVQFTISIGDSDIALTDSSNISTTCPTGWSLKSSDSPGIFTFQPSGGSAMIGPDGLTFEFSNIAVNDQVGGTPFKIEETVTLNNQPQSNNTSFTLSKFPQNFALQYFNVNPTGVPPGGSVTVSWSGSGNTQDVTYDYSLSYDSTTISNLPNVDSYPVANLFETTVFTLNITAGSSTLYQQQKTVTVGQPVIEEFGVVGNPGGASVNSVFHLYWQTQNVDHCTLSLDGIPFAYNLPANVSKTQGYAVTAPNKPGTYLYTLSAASSQGGAALDSSLTMVIDPLWLVTSIEIEAGLITGLLVSADGSRLYVAGEQLMVIDTATREVIKSINLPILSENPMALSPDGSELYIASFFESGGVLKIDTSSWQVQTISVPEIEAGSKIWGVLMGAASGSNLIVCATSNSLSTFYVLDPSNNFSLVQKLDLGVLTNTFAINPQGNQVCYIDYNALTNIASFCLYDVTANTKSSLKTISTDLILCLSSNSDGSEYYAISRSFIAINPATGAISCSPDTKMSLLGFACSPDKTRLYTIANVINEPITSIWEVDANTLQQTAVLYTGSDLVKMAISPDGKQLYVICQAEDASKNSQLLIFGIG